MMYWLIGIVTLCILTFYIYFGNYAMYLFYKCMKLDVRISYWELACMKHRGVPINDLISVAIKLKEYDISVKIKDLELHRKSGGRVGNVANILINAKRKKIELSYHQAAIMDMDEINKQKKNQSVAEQSDKTATGEQVAEQPQEKSPEQPLEQSSEQSEEVKA